MAEEVHLKSESMEVGEVVPVGSSSMESPVHIEVANSYTTIPSSPVTSAAVISSITVSNGSSSISTATAAAGPLATVNQERINLTDSQLKVISRDELVRLWQVQDSFINALQAQMATNEAEISSLREIEIRIKQQNNDLILREKVLVRRLATKEQEIQEYAGQLSELKANQAPGAVALRQALLDPAVNLLLQRLRQEIHSTRTRLEETQNELSAWKFTPDSNTGKRLMAKCRLLYQENEELGKMISSGRLAKLEGDLALQKSFSEEVKKSQSELDEFLQELDEDVEGMQSTIYYLQQELRKSKDTVASLEQELNSFRTNNSETNVDGVRVSNSSVNGVKDSSFIVPCENKQEEMTNGVVKTNEDWGNEEASIDSSEVILKINVDAELSEDKMDSQDEISEKKFNKHSLTNNNRINSSPRKRTVSEDSDDVPLSKKVKLENSENSVCYKDDELGLTNGEFKTRNIS